MELFESLMKENKKVTKEENKKSKVSESKSRRRVRESYVEVIDRPEEEETRKVKGTNLEFIPINHKAGCIGYKISGDASEIKDYLMQRYGKDKAEELIAQIKSE